MKFMIYTFMLYYTNIIIIGNACFQRLYYKTQPIKTVEFPLEIDIKDVRSCCK